MNIMKRITWTKEEEEKVFAKVKELQDSGETMTRIKMWMTAQQCLPADRIRPSLYYGNLNVLTKHYKAWAGITPIGKKHHRRTPRPAPVTPLAAVYKPIFHVNFCPGCGFDLARIAVL